MPKQSNAILTFNRGRISRYGLARIDLNRTALSAETQTNWMPRTLGSMMLRPGLGYLGGTRANARAKNFSFVFSSTDTAEIEITAGHMRVLVDDQPIVRVAATSMITNGNFTSDISGWTDDDEAGGASSWSAGQAALLGNDSDAARLTQAVNTSSPGVEHALRLVVTRGPVSLRVGSSAGGDQYIAETSLGTGTHSLAFTPSGTYYVRIQNRRSFTALVDSIVIEGAGDLDLPIPWTEAVLPLVRMTQSGDVLFVACAGYQQRKIERRTPRSWSVVLYAPETGPFRSINTTTTALTPSGLTGDITLQASAPLFLPTSVGALYRMQSTGQIVNESITAANQFTDPIRIAGVEGQRAFGVTVGGTFVGTLTLQYSVGEPGSWVDVKTYTGPVSESYNDELDNQIIYYRLGIKSGNYTSGTATAGLQFTSGSITGIVRVTAYVDSQTVSAVVLQSLGAITATIDWSESIWSDRRGWPSAVALYEGRLWWFGKDRSIGSISDAFEDFDDDFEGDAGPITRSIGEGPVDAICWALPMQRLLIGTEGAEFSARSSSFDEPLTATNFNIKPASTQGSAKIAAVRVDSMGMFVQRSGQKLFQLSYNIDSNDYKAEDLTVAVPDMNEAGIVHIAVQRQPDTRIHCLRADGTVGVLVFDGAENVICWLDVTTEGIVEDCLVQPGIGEDRVTYWVNRNGIRCRERWALESECRGGMLNKQADSFVIRDGLTSVQL